MSELPLLPAPTTVFSVVPCSAVDDLSAGQRRRLASLSYTKCCTTGDFKVLVAGTDDYPDSYILSSSNIIAGLLDRNLDGEADNPAVLQGISYATAAPPPLMQGAPTKEQEDRGDGLPEEGDFAYAFSLQTYKARTGEDPRPIMAEEVFHMMTQYGWGRAYPNLFGSNDWDSLMCSEMTRAECVHWVHPSNICHSSGVQQNPPLEGGCDYPSCDCVEWFHQVAMILGGVEPGWHSELIPRTTEELRETLSTEFLEVMDDPTFAFPKDRSGALAYDYYPAVSPSRPSAHCPPAVTCRWNAAGPSTKCAGDSPPETLGDRMRPWACSAACALMGKGGEGCCQWEKVEVGFYTCTWHETKNTTREDDPNIDIRAVACGTTAPEKTVAETKKATGERVEAKGATTKDLRKGAIIRLEQRLTEARAVAEDLERKLAAFRAEAAEGEEPQVDVAASQLGGIIEYDLETPGDGPVSGEGDTTDPTTNCPPAATCPWNAAGPSTKCEGDSPPATLGDRMRPGACAAACALMGEGGEGCCQWEEVEEVGFYTCTWHATKDTAREDDSNIDIRAVACGTSAPEKTVAETKKATGERVEEKGATVEDLRKGTIVRLKKKLAEARAVAEDIDQKLARLRAEEAAEGEEPQAEAAASKLGKILEYYLETPGDGPVSGEGEAAEARGLAADDGDQEE